METVFWLQINNNNHNSYNNDNNNNRKMAAVFRLPLRAKSCQLGIFCCLQQTPAVFTPVIGTI